MPRIEGLRQLPSKKCGCPKCMEKYPIPERRSTKKCSANWQWRIYDDAGNRISGTERTQDDAKNAMNRARAEISSGTWIDPARGKITLAAWRVKWLETRVSLEDATIAKDDSHWKAHIEPRWGSTTLRTLANSHLQIQAWVAHMEKTYAHGTVWGAFKQLDLMMKAAVRDRRIPPHNPCEGVKVSPPKKKHATESRPPTIDQITDSVRCIANPIYRQLPLLVLETGLRWGEVAGLPLEAIDLDDEGVLHVWQVLEEVRGHKKLRAYPKSDAGNRTIPLTVAAKQVIRIQLELQPPDKAKRKEPIFRGRNGALLSRNSYRDRIWLPATILAGVHREEERPSGKKEHWPTIHDIRSTWASRLENNGVPESTRKELLGHERPGGDVTWLYTHGAADTKALVLRALGDEPETPVEPVRRLRLVV